MFEDFVKKLRKIGIGADESTDIPEFPTYEEVKPMNTEKYEEIKKPVAPIVANTGDADSSIEAEPIPSSASTSETKPIPRARSSSRTRP